jgi:putative tryptophan/tyrosine transport system substrate-binding protein
MRRREFIALVSGAGAWPMGLLAQSQTAKRVVGVLSPFQPLAGPARAFDAFKQRMRELGWLAGQNIVFEYRWAEGQADRLVNLASELAAKRARPRR